MIRISGAESPGDKAHMLVAEVEKKLQTLACDLPHPRSLRHRLCS